MPYAKKYFMEKTQRLLPNYRFVLWTKDNITRENFPVAYDTINTLIDYQ